MSLAFSKICLPRIFRMQGRQMAVAAGGVAVGAFRQGMLEGLWDAAARQGGQVVHEYGVRAAENIVEAIEDMWEEGEIVAFDDEPDFATREVGKSRRDFEGLKSEARKRQKIGEQAGPQLGPPEATGNSMYQAVGGQEITGEIKTNDGVRYLKTSATFVNQYIGNKATTTSDAIIGIFNPVDVGNARLVQTSNNIDTEEWSSHFKQTDDSAVDMAQWDEPGAFHAEGVGVGDGDYRYYNCEHAKVMVEFTNDNNTEGCVIYYKLVYPGNMHYLNPTNAGVDGLTDPDSMVSLKLTTAGNALYSGVNRQTHMRLHNQGLVHKIILGPNSSNGRPNIGAMFAKINVKELLNTVADETLMTHLSSTAHPLETQYNLSNLTAFSTTNEAITHYNLPKIVFWAHTDTPDLKPIGSSTLRARGVAHYTLRAFGKLPNDSTPALAPDTA